MNERVSAIAKVWPSKRIGIKFFDGKVWSQCDYGQLRNDIERTRLFFQKLSYGGKVLVGFCVSPSLGLPALILGTSLSSCPFVFLPNDPPGFSKDLLRKLGLCWLVTVNPTYEERFAFSEQIELQSKVYFVYRYLDYPNNVKITNDEFYLYATTSSGSTGAPKVVRVPESSILPNILDFSLKMDVQPSDGILLSTALTFDPSIVEFYMSLLNSSPWIIVSDDVKRSPDLLLKAIQNGNVAFYQTTPSLFKLWTLEQKRNLLGKKSNLKYLVLGGEQFPSCEEVKKWQPTTNVRIYNTYGLSEVSCWATLNMAFPNENWTNFSEFGLDIGESLSETQLMFTKDPSSELHHLMIGSTTRVCAVENECFGELGRGEQIYRLTGDLFKVVDKKYYFWGRTDQTLKRFGKKIDVSWMEEKCREVGLDCAVSIRYVEKIEDFRLFLFIVGSRHTKAIIDAIHTLKKILPGDHWPDSIEFVKSLPVSPHGKLDRTALESLHPTVKTSPSLEKFTEFWNLFTNGRLTYEKSSKGFLASGGNSFSAVLMINSLNEAGFPENPELLLALMKDESLDKCWALTSSKNKVKKRRRRDRTRDKSDNKLSLTTTVVCSSGFTTVTDLALNSNSFTANETRLMGHEHLGFLDRVASEVKSDESVVCSEHPSVTMALKGRVWPLGPPFVDHIWTSTRDSNLLKSWSVDLGKCIDASPLGVMKNSCVDSFIIVGSHSGLVAVLNCFTGDVISLTQLPDRVESSACLSSDHSFYYIGCYNGHIYRICISDGEVAWSFQTQDMVKSTCVLHCKKIFIGSYDKHVYALSEGGDLFWKQLVGPVTIPVLPFRSSVIVGTLCKKVWRLSTNDGSILCQIVVSSPLFSNLALTIYPGHPNYVLASPVDGIVQWRDAETLKQVEELAIQGETFSSPVIASNQLTIIASGKTIHCLHLFKRLWSRDFHDRIVSTPFVVGSRAVVITVDGTLHLLDDSGAVLSTYEFPGEVFSSPIVIGPRLFVGCRDNHFYSLLVPSSRN